MVGMSGCNSLGFFLTQWLGTPNPTPGCPEKSCRWRQLQGRRRPQEIPTPCRWFRRWWSLPASFGSSTPCIAFWSSCPARRVGQKTARNARRPCRGRYGVIHGRSWNLLRGWSWKLGRTEKLWLLQMHLIWEPTIPPLSPIISCLILRTFAPRPQCCVQFLSPEYLKQVASGWAHANIYKKHSETLPFTIHVTIHQLNMAVSRGFLLSPSHFPLRPQTMQPGRSLKPQLHRPPSMVRQWLHRHHLMGMTRIGCPAEVDSVPKKRGRQLCKSGGPQLKPMVCPATVHCCPPKRMDYFPAKTASQWLQWLLTALGLFGLEKQETTDGCSKLCNWCTWR